MSLRLVPPPKEKNNPFEKTSSNWSETAKIMFLGCLMIFVPMMAYALGKHYFDHTMGTHFGFFTGTGCMLFACYLIYFSSWFEHLHNHSK